MSTSPLDGHLEKVKFNLAYRVSLLFTLIFALMTIAHYDDKDNLVVMALGFIICLFSFLYNLKTKNFKVVYYIFSITGVLITGLTLNLLPSATHFGDFIWMFCAIVLAFFGLSNRIGVALLIICTLYIGVYIIFNVNENIITQQPRTSFQKFSLFAEIIAGIYSGIYMIYLIVKFHKFSQQTLLETNKELQIQYDTIKLQDEEKTILVKEIHHRVKNNLQIISSLLRMQSNELKNQESKQHFQEAIDRIFAMSMIHQKLYQGESLSKVNLKEYFEDLIIELIRLYENDFQVTYEIVLDIDKIGLKSIVPIGLMVNELASNSLKHAFKHKQKGNLHLSFIKNDDDIQMKYSDNGSWSDGNSSGFGIELIDLLIEQLEGKVEVSKSEQGTIYNITFTELRE